MLALSLSTGCNVGAIDIERPSEGLTADAANAMDVERDTSVAADVANEMDVERDASVADTGINRDVSLNNDLGTDSTHADDASNGEDVGPTVPARCRDFGPLRAFPGAVGFGAASVGGRGGQVLVVTNLNDSGPGSLRAAVDAEGPRTVVFAVGGTIELQSTLNIRNPNITIAGQSAPGGGIALKTADSVTTPAIITQADDIILQHLRVRPGPSTQLSNSVDAITVVAGKRIMLANMSFSWATDENVNYWYDATDITLQDSIISECLWNSTHEGQQPHSKGLITGADNARMSFVRNVFAHNDDRSPLITAHHPYEVINNLIYNGYQVGTALTMAEGSQANLIGNVYLPGPNYRPARYQIIVSNVVPSSLYVDDNISPRSDVNDPWAAIGRGGVHDGIYNGTPMPEEARSLVQFPMSSAPISPIAAATLQDLLLPTVGASLPTRDAVDARVIADIINGTGRLIDHPDDVGGWPVLDGGTPLLDSDGDGLPDEWEIARGLDPNDPADAVMDRDNDGYTNIEEYLACIVPGS